jgi:hypothetical protein
MQRTFVESISEQFFEDLRELRANSSKTGGVLASRFKVMVSRWVRLRLYGFARSGVRFSCSFLDAGLPYYARLFPEIPLEKVLLLGLVVI